MLRYEGWSTGMIYDIEGQFRPIRNLQKMFPSPVNIMIAGHTHQDRLEFRNGVILVNSGSITFSQHKELRLGTVGFLDLEPGKIRVEVFPLGETPGSPNPGIKLLLEVVTGKVANYESPVITSKRSD